MLRIRNCLLATCVGMAAAGSLSAQSAMSGSTSSGLFGSRSLGQGTTARSGSSFGSGAGGASATPGNAVESAQADAGQASGDERFIRENRAAGAFVGADTADTTTFFGQSQGAALSGLEQFAAAAAQRDFQNQNGNTNSRIQLRPRLVLGFNSPALVSRDLTSRFSQRLAKMPQLEILENVEVAIVGRTVVLRGRVATDRDRLMIAQLASLEPGVDAVQNDLLVGLATGGSASSPQQTAVSPFAEPESAALPKSATTTPDSNQPAMNSPELAPPLPPRGPRAD